jgi:tetratricopeptide (TPR) repeat protein
MSASDPRHGAGSATEELLDLIRRGAQLEGSGDRTARDVFQLALEAADAALAVTPGDSLARLGRSLVLMSLGRDPEAVDELTRAIETTPDDAALHIARGRLAERHGDASTAAADYEAAARLSPGDASTHRDLGDAKLSLGDRTGALAEYDRALELNPAYVEVYRRRAAELLLDGRAAEAARDYAMVIELGAATGPAYRDLGNARAAMEDYDGAVEAFSRGIELQGNLTDAYIGRAQAHGHRGDPENAIADYTRALDVDPTLAKAYRGRGRQCLTAGRFSEADADLTRAIQLGDRGPDTRYGRGSARAWIGNLAGAVEDFSKAIADKPEFADAYFARAQAYVALVDYERALADYESFIALVPGSPQGYLGRANALVAIGDVEKALWDYDRAVDLDPSSAEAHGSRIYARFVLGDDYMRRRLPKHQRKAYIQALEGADQALSETQAESTFHYYRAAALRLLNAFDRAVDAALEGLRSTAPNDVMVPSLHREAADALRWWGESLRLPEKFEASLEQLDRAEQASPGTVDPLIYELQGHALLDLKRWEDASERFALAIEAAPRSSRAYLGHGKAQLMLGRHDEAIAILESALDPEWAELQWIIWAHTGRALAFAATGDADRRADEMRAALGTAETAGALATRAYAFDYFEAFDDAAADLRAAVEQDPESAMIRNALAWLLLDHITDSPERLGEAKELAERALELEGDGPERAYYLDTAGHIAYRLERYHEAVGHLRRAVALDSYHLVLRAHLEDAERELGIGDGARAGNRGSA